MEGTLKLLQISEIENLKESNLGVEVNFVFSDNPSESILIQFKNLSKVGFLWKF